MFLLLSLFGLPDLFGGCGVVFGCCGVCLVFFVCVFVDDVFVRLFLFFKIILSTLEE